MEVNVITHSLAGHYLTLLRDKNTDTPQFRETLERIAALLFVEASRDLPAQTVEVETPLEKTIGAVIEKPAVIIPILRAGLTMVRGIENFCPEITIMHLGVRRNEETLQPEPYYSSLTDQIEDSVVFILDPMLATGGTLAYALNQVGSRKPLRVEILSVLAAPEGIEKVSTTADKLAFLVRLWVLAVDRGLNEKGYILPGLGDAGDRAFGTK